MERELHPDDGEQDQEQPAEHDRELLDHTVASRSLAFVRIRAARDRFFPVAEPMALPQCKADAVPEAAR